MSAKAETELTIKLGALEGTDIKRIEYEYCPPSEVDNILELLSTVKLY